MNLEELEAAFLAFRDQVPTLEEQWFSVPVQSWNGAGALSGSTRFTLMIAPVLCRILSVDMITEYGAVPASNSNYWTASLERGNQTSGFPDIATKSTQPSGPVANGAIIARTSWSFDSADWGSADLSKGQLLCVNWVKTGNPPAIDYPMLYTIRYRPL